MHSFFKGVLLALDGCLILLFLAGYAGYYVHPRHLWGLQLIAIGLPYLSIGIVFITVWLLAISWWKLMSLHLVLCLLALGRFGSFEQLKFRPQINSSALTVMTFNGPYKYNWRDPATGRAYPVSIRAQAMEQLLLEEKPEVISLQGVTLGFQKEAPHIGGHPHILRLFELGYKTVRPEQPQTRSFFQPVVSRIPIEEHKRIVLGNSISGDTSVVVTRARLRWAGQDVVLYNLHLKSFNDDRPWKGPLLRVLDPRAWRGWLRNYKNDFLERAHEAKLIKRHINAESGPLIVCGDFNSTPHNWVYRELSRGLKDSAKSAGRGWGATYHMRLPLVRIDHILVSPHWQVLEEHVADADFSDHLPVVAHLTLASRSVSEK